MGGPADVAFLAGLALAAPDFHEKPESLVHVGRIRPGDAEQIPMQARELLADGGGTGGALSVGLHEDLQLRQPLVTMFRPGGDDDGVAAVGRDGQRHFERAVAIEDIVIRVLASLAPFLAAALDLA